MENVKSGCVVIKRGQSSRERRRRAEGQKGRRAEGQRGSERGAPFCCVVGCGRCWKW